MTPNQVRPKPSVAIVAKSLHIPFFEAKFQYLFSRHPSIRNYTALARALKVTPALIAGWKNGTEYTRPEHIPIRHCGRVCEHLLVSEAALCAPDLQAFKITSGVLSPAGQWDRAVLQSVDSDAMRILRASEVREHPAVSEPGDFQPR